MALANQSMRNSQLDKTGRDDVAQLLAQAEEAVRDVADPGTTTRDQSSIDLLLNESQSALSSLNAPATALPPGATPFELKDLAGAGASNEPDNLDLLRDVQLDLKIELGRTQMQLENVLHLRQGAVVALDKLAGDPVDIFANGRLIARGEVLVLNDNYCVRVVALIASDDASD